MNRSPLFGATSASLTLLFAVFQAPGAVAQDRPIEDRVEVVERVVLVEVPPGTRADPDELSVLEGGAAREVVALDPVEPGDWHVLIYVDWARTPAPMIWRGALVLARQAEDLTKLGTVRVIDGGSDSSGEDAAIVEPRQLVDRLAAVAARAAEMPATSPARGPEEDRAADAALLEATGSRCAGMPCLLVLVSDGYSAETASRGEDPEPVGRRLSVAGWTVLALPVVEHDPGLHALPDSTAQQSSPLLGLVPVFRVWPWKAEKQRGAGQPLSTLDTLTEPRWAPLRTWADLTGGWIVRHQDEVPDLLDRLAWRRLLVYRAPAGSGEGESEPVPIEVLDAQGRPLEAPRWVEPVARPGGP